MNIIFTVNKYKAVRRYSAFCNLKPISMKKKMVFVLLVVTLFSCKKDNEVSNPVTIDGTWIPISSTYYESTYINGDVASRDTAVFIGQPGEYLRIGPGNDYEWKAIESTSNPDGTVWYGDNYIIMSGSVSASYGIVSPAKGKLTLEDSGIVDDYDIVSLTHNLMTLKYIHKRVRGNGEVFETIGILEFKL